jgi:hypothetical protein
MEKTMSEIKEALAYYSFEGKQPWDSRQTESINLADPKAIAKEFCRCFTATKGSSEYTHEPDDIRKLATEEGAQEKYTLFEAARELLGTELAASVFQAAADGMMATQPILGTALAYQANNALPTVNRFPLTSEQESIMAENPYAIRIPAKAGRQASTLFPSTQSNAVIAGAMNTAGKQAEYAGVYSDGRYEAVNKILTGQAADQRYGPNG